MVDVDVAPRRAHLARPEDAQAPLTTKKIALEDRDDSSAERRHVSVGGVQPDVVLARQTGKVERRVETRLVEEIVAPQEPAGVLHAPLHAVAAGRTEEIVARVDGIEACDAARRAVPAVDRKPWSRRQKIDVFESVRHVEAAEGAEQAPERNRSAAADLPEAAVVGLPLEDGKPECPGPPEKPGLGEIQGVSVGARAGLDVGGEDLAAAEKVTSRVRRLEEAPLQPRDAAPDLDFVAAGLGPLHLDVHAVGVPLRLDRGVVAHLKVPELRDLAQSQAHAPHVEQVLLDERHFPPQDTVACRRIARELDAVHEVLLVLGDGESEIGDVVVLLDPGVDGHVEVPPLAVILLQPFRAELESRVVEDQARAQRHARHHLRRAEHAVALDLDLADLVLRPFDDRHRQAHPLLGLPVALLFGLQLGLDPFLPLFLGLPRGRHDGRRLLEVFFVLERSQVLGRPAHDHGRALSAVSRLLLLATHELDDLGLDRDVEVSNSLVGGANILRVLVELGGVIQRLGGGPGRQPERLLGQLEELAQPTVLEHRVAHEVDVLDLRLGSLVDIEGDLALPLPHGRQAGLGARL